MDVTVVIPTFRRPDQLVAAVQSVFGQQGCESRGCEIVVVDNDPSGSAETVVRGLKGAFPVVYHHEPRPGVSHARNCGLAAAQGRYVAFLDDDEVADPQWLAALLDAQARSGAGVVFGPVMARSDRHSHAAELLTCNVDAPTGTRVGSSLLTPFWRRDPTMAFPRLCSGNVLMDRAMLMRTGARFDPKLGATGGEDTLFFNQLFADGVEMVWCADALVTEAVPENRAERRFLVQRAFRGGQITSYVPMCLRRPQPLTTALSMAIGLCQLAYYGPLAVFHHWRSAPARHETQMKAAAAAGKLLWSTRFRAKVYG